MKQVYSQVRTQARDQVMKQVYSQVRTQARDQVYDQVGNQVRNQVNKSLKAIADMSTNEINN